MSSEAMTFLVRWLGWEMKQTGVQGPPGNRTPAQDGGHSTGGPKQNKIQMEFDGQMSHKA